MSQQLCTEFISAEDSPERRPQAAPMSLSVQSDAAQSVQHEMQQAASVTPPSISVGIFFALKMSLFL